MITLKTLLEHAKGFFGGKRRAEYVKFLVPNIMKLQKKKKIVKFERSLNLLKRYKKIIIAHNTKFTKQA